MSLDQVRSDFRALLNRDDCTADDADKFLRLGLGRIQRELRVPALERVYTLDATTEGFDMVLLPADFLEAIDVLVDSVPLNRMSYRLLVRESIFNAPRSYARYRNGLFLRGSVPTGSRFELLYYGEATPLVLGTDENEITTSCPDLWVYSALGYAGDFFQIDGRADFEKRYSAIRESMNDQARADDFSGLQAIQPLYSDPGF